MAKIIIFNFKGWDIFLLNFLVSILYILPGHLYSQDTLNLQPVHVKSLPWISSEAGTKVVVLDSTLLSASVNQNLSQVLNKLTPIYFKNYGISGLSSVNLRGTSANHTALIWNGIKIQLPSMQQTDYSIVPVVFWDEIAVQYGPVISLNGADVAGGAIHLRSGSQKTEGFALRYLSQIGSFGYQQQAISAGYRRKYLSLKSQVSYLSAENDFKYLHTSGKEVSQQNAAVRQVNFQQHLNFNFNKFSWNNTLWIGRNDRELARTITGYNNPLQDDFQKDNYTRVISSVSGNSTYVPWQASYAYLNDDLIYNGSLNESQQHIIRGQAKRVLSENIQFSAGLQHEIVRVENNSYNEDQQRSDYNINLKAQILKYIAHLGFKQIYIKEFSAPFIPSAGFARTFKFDDRWSAEATAKGVRHFRFPTLNDRFWNPGGNPNLRPEQGWSLESTARVKYSKDIILSAEVTAYHLNVNDWILWRPTNSGFWSPENIWKVKNNGMEAILKSLFSISQIEMEIAGQYTYTRSRNESEGGNQLIYVPIHQGNLNLILSKNNWFISTTSSYTGKRYTTIDNRQSDTLPQFLLWDMGAGYNFSFKDWSLNVQAELDNVLNTDYQTLRNRAMPGRNYQLQLIINLQ
jgi:vitamin B12 transporter